MTKCSQLILAVMQQRDTLIWQELARRSPGQHTFCNGQSNGRPIEVKIRLLTAGLMIPKVIADARCGFV